MSIKGDTPALKRAGEKLLNERLHELKPQNQLTLFPNYETQHTNQLPRELPKTGEHSDSRKAIEKAIDDSTKRSTID